MCFWFGLAAINHTRLCGLLWRSLSAEGAGNIHLGLAAPTAERQRQAGGEQAS